MGKLNFKLIISFVFMMFLFQPFFSQIKIERGNYFFTKNVTAKNSKQLVVSTEESSNNESDNNSGDETSNQVIDVKEIYKGAYIDIWGYDEEKNEVYYKYLKYREKKYKRHLLFLKKETEEKNPFSVYNNKLFKIDANEFIYITQPLYSRYKGVNVGVYSIPFRLRGLESHNDFDFESSLSLQANLVFGFGKRKSKKSWLDLSVGLGLTSISLNSRNSNVLDERTASAFTISFGSVIKPSKYANIGIFLGFDNLGRQDQKVNWDYNNEAWIGLGINIGFNEISNPSIKKNSETQRK